MSTISNGKSTNTTPTITPGPQALQAYLLKYGRLPSVDLSIFPLEQNQGSASGTGAGLTQIYIDKFINYSFAQSVLSPVSAFQCEVYYKNTVKPQSGDIMVVSANGIPIATGIIDQADMETDKSGTRLTIQGRDLLGQWEDQDAVNIDSSIVYSSKATIKQVIAKLATNTRINSLNAVITSDAPRQPYMFATQPGESKLSAMQRYCEALDIYFWVNGAGNIVVGRPDMYGVRTGGVQDFFYNLSSSRKSNVLSIRSTRNTTQIPNLILPIWNGQETVQSRVSASQCIKNGSAGPARLLKLGHITAKAIIVSTPDGSSPQDLAELNTLIVAGQNTTNLTKAGASTILQAYAKRAIARANLRELMVQISVPGHFNTSANPYKPDQLYNIQYEDDGVSEDMYLYEVEYTMTEDESQRTRLHFCRQTALVSDVRAL